jgi:hypothetical protein
MKITGRVEVLVNGTRLLNKAGAIASGLGISGEPPTEQKEVMGDTGLHGFIEEPVVAKCEVKITDRSDVMLDSLARIKGNGTVIFRTLGGGKVYTMKNATCVGNFKLTAGEGETEVAFIGAYWTEGSE